MVLGATALSLAAPPVPCGGLDPGYPPIVAFELARSPADLEALFGAGPSACRDALASAFDAINVADLALFVPAYSALLAAWFAAHRSVDARLARIGWACVLVAAVSDGLENACLLGLTAAEVDPASPWLARLPWATAGKWLALGASGAVQAGVSWRMGGIARASAAVALAAPAATAVAIAAPNVGGPTVAGTVGLAWLVMLAGAAARAR